MSDFPNWLAEHEIEMAAAASTDWPAVEAPPRRWQRAAEILANVVAGLIGGMAVLAVCGGALYFSRVPL